MLCKNKKSSLDLGADQAKQLFFQRCQELNLARTNQRWIVYDIVSRSKQHPTADMVYDQAKSILQGISRASVYRILETFAQVGLIHKLDHSFATVRYEGNLERHCHMICTHCGKVLDYFDSKIDLTSFPEQPPEAFVVQDFSIIFQGLCQDCAMIENDLAESC